MRNCSGNKMRSKEEYRSTRKRNHVARYERLRKVKDGFPIKPRILSREEIQEYLSHDTITCFLCGRDFKNIIPGAHLQKIHGINSEEYKNMYGIPFRTGLQSKPGREKSIKLGKDRISTGIVKAFSKEEREKAWQALRDGKMRRNRGVMKRAIDNIKGES